MKNKVGFFGGCFNPITNAHLELIRDVIEKENLSKVYFVPMGDFYQKNELIPSKYRIEMLNIALKDEPKMETLNISNQTQKTYAIDSFKRIDEEFPDAKRFFIMGSDNYNQIKNWKESKKLIENYNYIILNRDAGNMKDISSSIVRKKIQSKEDYEYLIPDKIATYIKQNNLYK